MAKQCGWKLEGFVLMLVRPEQSYIQNQAMYIDHRFRTWIGDGRRQVGPNRSGGGGGGWKNKREENEEEAALCRGCRCLSNNWWVKTSSNCYRSPSVLGPRRKNDMNTNNRHALQLTSIPYTTFC
jgi:hypothetical protein